MITIKPSTSFKMEVENTSDELNYNAWNSLIIDDTITKTAELQKKLDRKNEIQILKEVMNILRHDSSEYFMYDSQKMIYVKKLNIKINGQVLEMLVEICEKNKVYHKLNAKIKAKRLKILGKVETLFYQEIENHMTNYDQLLQEIQQRIISDEKNFMWENSFLIDENCNDSNNNNNMNQEEPQTQQEHNVNRWQKRVESQAVNDEPEKKNGMTYKGLF